MDRAQPARAPSACLLAEVSAHLCGVPLGAGVETLRPLPIERLPGLPEAILGLSIIRGVTVPVVDLAVLFREPAGAARHWVFVRAEERHLALAASRVIGVHEIGAAPEGSGLAFAARIAAPFIAAVAMHAGRLLAVLDVARIFPEIAVGAGRG